MNLKVSCSGILFDQNHSDAAGHPAMGDNMKIAVGARKLRKPNHRSLNSHGDCFSS